MSSIRVVLTLLFLTLSASPLAAQSVQWKPEYRKISLAEQGLTVGYLVTTGAANLMLDHYGEPNWVGPIGPDTPIHEALLATTEGGRETATHVSDGLIYASHLWVIGEAAFTYWAKDSPEAGWQMFWISAHAVSLGLFLNTVAKFTFRRERPGSGRCYDNEDDPDCPQEPTVSFYSGHTSAMFAIAGATCAHELHLPIWSENPWLNTIPCVATSLAAVATGTLRIVANKHYFTDVITGAVLGGSIGFLYPYFRNYMSFGVGDADVMVNPYGDGQHAGLQLLGSF